MRALLVALLFLLTSFAGCSEPGGPVRGSALWGVDIAKAAATDWAKDAYLVAIVTNEGAANDDGRRGDGLVSVWGYLFEAESRQGHHASIGVARNGTVVFAMPFNKTAAENPLVRPTGGGAPLGDRRVDSDAVADALDRSFAGYYRVAAQQGMEVTMALSQVAGEHATWTVEMREVERTKRLVLSAEMDAVTGGFIPPVQAEPELRSGP